MSGPAYQLWRRCDDFDPDNRKEMDELSAMTERARPAAPATFRREVGPALEKWATQCGYEPARSRKGLTLAKDWHVSYHRSRFGDTVVYYLVWSAFEVIFTPGGIDPILGETQ